MNRNLNHFRSRGYLPVRSHRRAHMKSILALVTNTRGYTTLRVGEKATPQSTIRLGTVICLCHNVIMSCRRGGWE